MAVFHRNRRFEERAKHYWLYFALGLILVLGIDLLTTLVATGRYGTGVEINPLMRWLLVQDPIVFVAVHVGVAMLVVLLFSRVIESVRCARAPHDVYLESAVRAWLGLLVGVGLFLVLNNLSVIVFGSSFL